MNVAFDSRAGRHSTGIARYSRSLLAALGERDGIEIVETHAPRASRTDVYHSPWIDGAQLRPNVPMVVTLHDVIPLKRPGEYMRSGVRFKLRYLAVQRASRVIVPTHAVAADAIRALALAPDRVAVVGEGVDGVFRARPAAEVEAVRARYRLPEQYLLWVGGLQSPDPRKRVVSLARAKRELPLVLVGAAGRWARELPDVTLTGLVPDEDLAAIYTGAHALVYPSDDEGYGLVPVEALACGCPVATCDIPPLREVLGDRASFTAPEEIDALVEAAEGLTRPAPEALGITWAQVAARTVEVYREAMDAGPPATGAGGTRRRSAGPRMPPRGR